MIESGRAGPRDKYSPLGLDSAKILIINLCADWLILAVNPSSQLLATNATIGY